jgi:hypothetical protein
MLSISKRLNEYDDYCEYTITYFNNVHLEIAPIYLYKLKKCVDELKEDKGFYLVFEKQDGEIAIGYNSTKKQWIHNSTEYSSGIRGCKINININTEQLGDILNTIKKFEMDELP